MSARLTAKAARIIVPAAAACLLLWAGPAPAAEYWLCAGKTTLTMPDPDGAGPKRGPVIAMWGFALDNNNDLSDGCGNAPQVPGPALVVPPGDTGLTVHLRNDLPRLNRRLVPVSIVIPGQASGEGGAPAGSFFTDAQGRERARSFARETRRGAPRTYTWPAFRPGTYLYMSGSHPALQVQMGLYGMASKNDAAGAAYPGVTYDQEVTLLYSEIQPSLHSAVARNLYGPGPTMRFHSTLRYRPTYFLVNGAPYESPFNSTFSAGTAGSTTLIRFLNAGLQTHVPVVHESYLRLVAEDGNPATYPADRYSVLLPAGKTVDALFTPAAEGTYPIYDRRLSLTNQFQTPGGLLSFLRVDPAGP